MEFRLGRSEHAKKAAQHLEMMDDEMKAAWFAENMALKTSGRAAALAKTNRVLRYFNYILNAITNIAVRLVFAAVTAAAFLAVSYSAARLIHWHNQQTVLLAVYVSLMTVLSLAMVYQSTRSNVAKDALSTWADIIDSPNLSVGEFLGFARHVSRLRVELCQAVVAAYITWVVHLSVASLVADRLGGGSIFSPHGATVTDFIFFWTYQSLDAFGHNLLSTFGIMSPRVTVVTGSYFSLFVWATSLSLWSSLGAAAWTVVRFNFKNLRLKVMHIAREKRKLKTKRWRWLELVDIPE